MAVNQGERNSDLKLGQAELITRQSTEEKETVISNLGRWGS